MGVLSYKHVLQCGNDSSCLNDFNHIINKGAKHKLSRVCSEIYWGLHQGLFFRSSLIFFCGTCIKVLSLWKVFPFPFLVLLTLIFSTWSLSIGIKPHMLRINQSHSRITNSSSNQSKHVFLTMLLMKVMVNDNLSSSFYFKHGLMFKF